MFICCVSMKLWLHQTLLSLNEVCQKAECYAYQTIESWLLNFVHLHLPFNHLNFVHQYPPSNLCQQLLNEFLLIERSAVLPDLALVTGLHADPAELDHGSSKGPEEAALVGRKLLHHRPRQQIGEQHLVRGEEPFALQQVPVVDIVEDRRGEGVHVDGDGGADVARARSHQQLRVRKIERRVHRRRGAEGVEALGEAVAVGEAHGVSSGEGDHVMGGEVVHPEEVGEEVEVEVRAREMTSYSSRLRDEPVAPAKLHREARAAGLATKLSFH